MEGELHQIFSALEREGVRYLVVGGVAVVLHGHLRMTADLDLVIELEPENIRAALRALSSLGYQPRAPVRAELLVDPALRRSWVEEKGMRVFSMWSPRLPTTEIDLFIEEPFPFSAAYARGVQVELSSSRPVVASIQDLIALKRIAGRPKDLEDISALEEIAREEDENG